MPNPATAWIRLYGGSTTTAPIFSGRRADADSAAAWARWHNPTLLAKVPSGAENWYLALEQARVEHLACLDLPGMAINLSAPADTAPAADLNALHRAARALLASSTLPKIWAEPWPGYQPSNEWWRSWFPERSPIDLREALDKALQAAQANLSAEHFLACILPLLHKLATLRPPQTQTEAATDAMMLMGEANTKLTPAQACKDDPAKDSRHPEAKSSGELIDSNINESGYRIYNRHRDEVLPARRLLQPADSLALASLHNLPQARARQLAARLQRRLQATRPRRWMFEQSSGQLDNRRLTKLLGSETAQYIFRREDDCPVAEACVTLLVDQSGSMRGLPQQLTAQAIDMAVHVLERCHVITEVLGYTTTHGADNPITQAWQAAGAPPLPGRLNSLRHIIYQTAGQSWRSARPGLGLLLRPNFGRENVDGEALEWAARRLARRPEPRKILLVLADGTPFDAATASANGRAYLSDHLRKVIASLEMPKSGIQLAAIGSSSAITRYYQRALVIDRAEAVADTLFSELEYLLS